ncbi:hypothetical protein V5279_37920 [Bradyrhizobium sp. 26S5]|uniref:hypothetical protein n=1 Tax=Bradyrhizobium sp. 26S5 TaxID=3139729 RepID=UPI0030CE2387
MMIFYDVNIELCRHRDAALTAFGNQLADAGIEIQGERFRTEMLAYAARLEQWRYEALVRIGKRIGVVSGERASAALH